MSQPAPTTSEVAGPVNLLRPLLLLSYSAYYIFPTVIDSILSLNLAVLTSVSEFKAAWFARFWVWFGPRSRDNAAGSVLPLLQNSAKGVCLDIGPGTGQWLYLFSRANNQEITKIYGVEPNRGMHKQLRENAVQAGLGDIYEIVGCGAEELEKKGGLQRESIDTVITVQCLCSIPTPQLIINNLFPLLKPGGKWLVFEHIRTKYQGEFTDYWQKAINIVWPHFFNGCDITRPTDQWLLHAGNGGWESVDLRPGAGEGRWDTVSAHLVAHHFPLRALD
ncbi:S-adenosyl-L-methionine-dependent methyltransferase [Teratosphaeria nubilosa]|uniref:S-adenosyl-L-methionine-dependent methyltransferase n=1 Tax=Teratosphaeria nubilosa TaxID=161662 RepID=A0A6G1LK54_9PEZI|nr:S-adenosyl-L-methionine-dependent methyltransferase [Teratosphaeria nubilosa]